jgi:hypothetical protein
MNLDRFFACSRNLQAFTPPADFSELCEFRTISGCFSPEMEASQNQPGFQIHLCYSSLTISYSSYSSLAGREKIFVAISLGRLLVQAFFGGGE